MSCHHPLKAFEGINGRMIFSDNLRKVITGPDGLPKVYYLPCGKCLGCRLDYAKDWSLRCVMESRLHKQNSFITLTYNEDNLPKEGVVKKHVQDFFKRLRSRLVESSSSPARISYLACGEYGSRTFRPHYHAIIFGWCPEDLKYFFTDSNSGCKVYKSSFLDSVWKHGFTTVGEDVSYECCNYVARYVVKKQIQEEQNVKFFEQRNKSFILSSRRPAIGLESLKRLGRQIVFQDEIVIPGRLTSKPPRYFDKKLKERYPNEWLDVLEKRKKAIQDAYPDESEMRKQLAIKEVYLKQRTQSILKGNENV